MAGHASRPRVWLTRKRRYDPGRFHDLVPDGPEGSVGGEPFAIEDRGDPSATVHLEFAIQDRSRAGLDGVGDPDQVHPARAALVELEGRVELGGGDEPARGDRGR